MAFKLVRPATIADAQFVSSNITEADYPAWAIGTTYALGDYVIYVVANVHRIYQSKVGSNVGNNPYTGDGTKWLLVGATNRWKMFDASVQSQSTRADVIDVVLGAMGRLDSVIVMNCACSTLQVKQTDAIDGLVYNSTISMISDSGITDWYAYFWEPIIKKTDAVFSDLRPYNNSTIEVIATDTGLTVALGEVVCGLSRSLGNTQYGAGLGIQDYSIKAADAFGNYSITQRAYSKKGRFAVDILPAFVDTLLSLLATFRADPVVYLGASDLYASTIVYGFYKNHEVLIQYPTLSILSIEIEGLT